MSKPVKHAIATTRSENYAEWYQKVIRGADLAELAENVRGCMVIKPWGFGIWTRIQQEMDQRFKATGHENVYFPIFIPVDLFNKEASHAEGFAKEMAVVTHHRIRMGENGLEPDPDSQLEEPLVVRPTSELIIMETFRNWVNSYRDLPIKINQWANVVRWEMRPRMFLRTVEFLWQEGHTAHADADEAVAEQKLIIELYRQVVEEEMAMPVIVGHKSPGERFPGAEDTLSIEAMMQDGRALQAGTSHYMGQNFSKAAEIKFQTKDETLDNPYTTSWGASTRLIGALIMTHADDDGLRLPPRIAPDQVVIVPITRGDEEPEDLAAFIDDVAQRVRGETYADGSVRVKVDRRLQRAANKRWDWVRKGAPVIIEIGPKDLEKGSVAVTDRMNLSAGKEFVAVDEFVSSISERLNAAQTGLYDEALRMRQARLVTDVEDWEAFCEYFSTGAGGDYVNQPGFVRAKWCGDEATEETLKELNVTIRCIPLEQSGTEGACIITGKPATTDAIFAKSY